MENVPTAVLENATIALNAPFNTVGDGQLSYGSLLLDLQPQIDITYPKNASAQLAAGHYLHVPLLLGSTANEGDPFFVAAELIQPGFVLPAVTRAVSDIQALVGLSPMRYRCSSEIVSLKLQGTCPDNATLAFRLRDAEVPSFRYQYQGKILVFMS
jgi:hypothetical protein